MASFLENLHERHYYLILSYSRLRNTDNIKCKRHLQMLSCLPKVLIHRRMKCPYTVLFRTPNPKTSSKGAKFLPFLNKLSCCGVRDAQCFNNPFWCCPETVFRGSINSFNWYIQGLNSVMKLKKNSLNIAGWVKPAHFSEVAILHTFSLSDASCLNLLFN